jgi:hypothetical protein
MVEKSKVLGLLTEEHDRLGRAIAKKRREMTEANDACRGPQDSIDKSALCACQLEFQLTLDRLQTTKLRYTAAISHLQNIGPLCAECDADISERMMKIPSILCCECAQEAEDRQPPNRPVRRTQFLEL